MKRFQHGYAVVAILAFALAVRLLAAWVWQQQANQEGHVFRFGDSESYWVLGNSIATGKPYEYLSDQSKVFRSPTYPLLLSLFAWIEPKTKAVLLARFFGCMLGTLCVWLIYRITRMLCTSLNLDQRFEIIASCSAAALASVYLGAIGMSIFILSEAIFCPLLLISLWLTLRSTSLITSSSETTRPRSPLMWLFCAGLVSGIAAMARPSWILWPAFIAIYFLITVNRDEAARWFSISRFRKVIQLTCVFIIGVVVAMMPWWYRNYQVTGRFVMTTLQVGASLYDSFHPGASGGSDEGMNFSGEFARQLAQDRQARQAGLSPSDPEDELPFECALDQRLKNAAIDWIKANPSDAAKLALVKFGRTWTPLPKAAQVGGTSLRIAEASGYIFIAITAIIGIARVGWRNPAVLFALPCVYFAAIHSIFVGSVRYRQPAILVLCVLAGIGTAWIVVKWIKPKQPMEN
jgi:hypothetical protein